MKKIFIATIIFLVSVNAQAAAIWTWEINVPQTINAGDSVLLTATVFNDAASTENFEIGSYGYSYPLVGSYPNLDLWLTSTNYSDPMYYSKLLLSPGQSGTVSLATLGTTTSISDGSYDMNFSMSQLGVTGASKYLTATLNFQGGIGTFDVTPVTVNPIPVPGGIWVFGSGLAGLLGLARRRAG